MSDSSGLGFGGVLLGFGVGWVVIQYFGVSWDVVPYLLILAGIGIIISSLAFRHQRSQVSELTGGVIGGLMIAIVISSVFGFSNIFPFGRRITGSGVVVDKDYDYQGFSVVEAGNGFNVEVIQDDEYSISVSIDDNALDFLEVSKSDETLSIDLEPGIYSGLKLEAKITMPTLEGLHLSGGASGDVSGFSSTRDIELELSGGSEIRMVGSAGDLTVDASGGSRVNLSNLICNDADINFSGGSNGSVHVEGILDANLSGGSQLTYYGDPELGDISTSGGSAINPK